MAGSMGWWFPSLITNPTSKMSDWYKQFDDAREKGYSVTSPMIAAHVDETWLDPFVRASCAASRCPDYLSWHFYVSGCSDSDDKLQAFVDRMDNSLKLIKEFPTIQGVLITEVGLLRMNGGPATCSDSVMVSAMRKLFGIMRRSHYRINGTSIVKHFSWFSKDGDGSTYKLALVDPSSGQLRPLGNAYVEECGNGTIGPKPAPTPLPSSSSHSPTLALMPANLTSLAKHGGMFVV